MCIDKTANVHSANVCSMSGQRSRRWSIIKTTLGQCLVWVVICLVAFINAVTLYSIGYCRHTALYSRGYCRPTHEHPTHAHFAAEWIFKQLRGRKGGISTPKSHRSQSLLFSEYVIWLWLENLKLIFQVFQSDWEHSRLTNVKSGNIPPSRFYPGRLWALPNLPRGRSWTIPRG